MAQNERLDGTPRCFATVEAVTPAGDIRNLKFVPQTGSLVNGDGTPLNEQFGSMSAFCGRCEVPSLECNSTGGVPRGAQLVTEMALRRVCGAQGMPDSPGTPIYFKRQILLEE